MIEVRDLWRVYEVGSQIIEAVRGLTLTVRAGEFISIVGHSGSGKSTLLSIVGGLARPTRGTITFDGIDIWQRDDAFRAAFRNANIGFVFQFASLIPTLDAVENVALPQMFSNGARKPSGHAKAKELLDLVSLSDKYEAFPNELSGGQQRRVAIARALINQPRIILADEPTGDLDEETEAEVMNFLFRSSRRHNAALVMATHNLALAQNADRMLRMKNGTLT